ncbi:asparagine synthase-related protein [Streptomyces sp. NPDC059070]|uniref:asparagine synthase-related protein n=1 Tax=Streptomyces sp. NPDC059070 TaxID=3346713 RepID=UPI00368DD2F1
MPLHRFVTGWFPTSPAPPQVVPRDSRTVLCAPGARIWTTGHSTTETAITGQPDTDPDLLLVTAGHCHASHGARRSALTAAHAGQARPALRLPGTHLTALSTAAGWCIAGDLAGVVPVYWARLDDGIWWSTAATPLAAVANGEPDLAWLLAEISVTGVDLRRGSCHFTRLRRVPAGYALTVDRSGDAAPVPLDMLRTSSPEDGAARLRRALKRAVTGHVHAHERLSCDLSGGIDSSTVTCIAARSRPVLAVTYTDTSMADSDDVRYARRVAASVSGITHTIVNGTRAGVSHFSGLEEPAALPVTDVPSLTLGLLSIKAAQLAPVVAYGSRAHLTGRGGDNVLEAARSHPVDQWLAGHRAQALRRAARYARAWRTSPWQAWRQLAATAATDYPRALEHLARDLEHREPPQQRQKLVWCSMTAGARWLTPGGRRAVAALVDSRVGPADWDSTPAVLHDRLALEWMAASHANFDQIARQRWGVGVHAPFLDTAVVEAARSVPAHLRMEPGLYKPLAQRSFTGLAPEFILHRPTKTDFSTSLYTGLAANAPALRRIVHGSRLTEAGLIDSGRLTASLEAAIAGAPAPLAELHTLLVTELWLTSVSTARATWWQPEPKEPACQ